MWRYNHRKGSDKTKMKRILELLEMEVGGLFVTIPFSNVGEVIEGLSIIIVNLSLKEMELIIVNRGETEDQGSY